MHRRPIGRGRWIAAISAVVLFVACILPWWRAGGNEGIPALSGNAFDGAGILVFLAALGTVALVTLPYASDAPVAIDRPLSYLLLLVAAVAGYGLRIVGLLGSGASFMPDSGPGLWLAGLALIGLARAVLEIRDTPTER